MIHLVGPGGAGKSTTGAALAERLGVRHEDYAQLLADREHLLGGAPVGVTDGGGEARGA